MKELTNHEIVNVSGAGFLDGIGKIGDSVGTLVSGITGTVGAGIQLSRDEDTGKHLADLGKNIGDIVSGGIGIGTGSLGALGGLLGIK